MDNWCVVMCIIFGKLWLWYDMIALNVLEMAYVYVDDQELACNYVE